MSGKRQEIEKYMGKKHIDILCLQETHQGENTKEIRKHYSWFFSGGTTPGAIHHGVGIVIRNKFRNYIEDINTINERLTIMHLKGQVNIHIFSAYAPTATAESADKETFYEIFRKSINQLSKRGISII